MTSLFLRKYFVCMNFLQDLNQAQRWSVEYTDGPMMVIAGAGSGKTRVLTYKIAYLIQKGWKPYNILALTFTNKAAHEMKERIAHLVGESYAKQVWMGTFHSVFAKILRREADKLGYTSNFTIYDTEDSKKLVTDIIKRMNLDDKNTYKPNSVFARISYLKNHLISPQQYAILPDMIAEDRRRQREYFVEVYKAYQKQLYKNSAMDFDDLLYFTNVLFRDFPEVLKKYQELFQYILVDEFQDTNFSQYLAVKQLAKHHQNVCVIGDDAQSIYSFRGADINNIVSHFRKDFSNYRLFKLEENYRSTKCIVEASNAIIKNNKNQIPKEIYTNNSKGELIYLYECMDEIHEAELVAKEILNLKNKNIPYSDIAILYRTNAQSRNFEDVFRKYQIPYKIAGTSFYQRKEIKDVCAYFRVVVNPNDEEALRRIINFPARGIGDTTIEKIAAYAYDNQTSVFEILQNIRLLQSDLNISNKQVSTIEHFVTSILNFRHAMADSDVYTLANEILNFSGIIKEYESKQTEESKDRLLNIKELMNAIEQFSKTERTLPEVTSIDEADPLQQSAIELAAPRTLDEFMREVSLLTSEDKENTADTSPKVQLMTIHLSKGLEFPYVFIVGAEEGLFPASRSIFESDIEEERRLFYVAITRAKKQVYLSYALKRYINGRTNLSRSSRFVNELPNNLVKLKYDTDISSNRYTGHNRTMIYWERDLPKPSITGTRQRVLMQQSTLSKNIEIDSSVVQSNKNLQKGDVVYHDKFGMGTVLEITGQWPETKAKVHFDTHGQKLLLLKFARLEKKG